MRSHKLCVNLPRILLVLTLIAVPPLAGGSSITAQTFGTKNIAQVRGIRTDVWTAQQPSGWYAIASPVGICTTVEPCTGYYFETGYIKGLITTGYGENVLQQYAGWKDPTGHPLNQFGLGNLNDNTWYQFKSLYSTSAGRWEAWLGTTNVVYFRTDLNFTTGSMVACGAEGGGTDVPLAVQCNNMQYKVGNNAWTLYDYSDVQHVPGYCAYKPYSYSVLAWGPGCQ